MGTIPGNSHPVPDGAYSPSMSGLSWMQDVTEATARQAAYDQVFPSMQSAKTSLFDNFVGKLFQGFTDVLNGLSGAPWLPGSVSSAAATIRDGMSDLAGRTDLLEGVRGFCMAYQTLNINTAWSLSENTREMPFSGPYGPTKGAHIDGNGITLDEDGAWRIDAMTRANSTSFAGSDGACMDIIVYAPDGTEYSRKRYDAWPGSGTVSIYGGHPLVVDGPGYYIRVKTWTGRWRWWSGGTMYSFLSAVKYDNRAINPGQSTVPDETQ